MKSEEEWMIQWTNVNQNLIDALVFFSNGNEAFYIKLIWIPEANCLPCLSEQKWLKWKEEKYEEKSNFTTGKELRNWLAYIGNQTKILITHIMLFQMRCESQVQSQLQFRGTTRNSVFGK